MQRESDLEFMRQALALARIAESIGEVPVGALIVHNHKIIGKGYNQPVSKNDPSAHAEILAIRSAANNIKNYRLTGSTLYVTLEPCIMCAGAILHGRIARVVFAARDERFGAVGSQLNLLESVFLNHQATVTAGVMEDDAKQLLQEFFRRRR